MKPAKHRLQILALVAALLLAALPASALTPPEERLVFRMREAGDLFDLNRVDEAAEELQAVLSAKPSPRFTRRLRAIATLPVLIDMRSHSRLQPLVDQIIDLANRGDQEVLNDPEFFQDLIDRVASDTREVRVTAHDDLFILGEVAVPHLIKLLDETHGGENQMRVVLALRELGPQATLALTEVLKSDNFVLRDNAVFLLGETRDPRALPELIRFYHEAEEAPLRAHIAEAVRKITGVFPQTLPDPQVTYQLEADRVLRGARDYATSPANESAIIWRWDPAVGELRMDYVPRNVYRELTARRFIRRGLAIGYSNELARLLPHVYLRLVAQLPENADPLLHAEVDKILPLAGVPGISRALAQALTDKNEPRIRIALDVLHDLGQAGNRLLTGDLADFDNDAAWQNAFLLDVPEIRYLAARAAISLQRPPTYPLGDRVVPSLVESLRSALGVGRFLIVCSDDKIANEAAAMLLDLPGEADTVSTSQEAVTKLSTSTTYGAVLLHEDHADLLNQLAQMNLRDTLPVVYLTTEENPLAVPDNVSPILIPLVSDALLRVIRERTQSDSNLLPRAHEALDLILQAHASGFINPGALEDRLGDLVARGDNAFSEKLLPLVATLGGTGDLVPLFALLESPGASVAAKTRALHAIGAILRRNPRPTDDMRTALLQTVAGNDAQLAPAAAAALAAIPLSSDDFADTFSSLTDD